MEAQETSEAEVTWEWCQREAHRLTGSDVDTDDNDIASMMLMAIKVGATKHMLKHACPKWTTAMEAAWMRLKANLVFRQGRIAGDWLHEEHGGIAFNMDLGIAKGWLARGVPAR